MEAKGHNGTIRFDGQYVTIVRSGFLARATIGKGEKRLHVSQITAVQFKPASAMVNGFIQFTVPGGVEQRSRYGSQTSDAARDENSVVFTNRQGPAFEQMRAAIDQAIAAQHAPQAWQQPMPMPPGPQWGPPPAPMPPAAPVSVADELAKLAALRDQGVLSPEEFEAQKARLLGG